MKNLKDKETFITIIILLVIFFPLAFIGTIKQIKENKKPKIFEKQSKEGYLYFYDDELYLGRYKCFSRNCDFAQSAMDNVVINKYVGNKKELGIISGKYAFIKDEGKIMLYSISLENEVIAFEEIKFYDADLENNIILASKEGKWGALSLDNMSVYLNYEYEFLGLTNKLNKEGEVKTDKLIAKKDNSYFIINNENEVISSVFTDVIYDFSDDYLIINKNEVLIYDYDGNRKLSDITIKDIYIYDNHYIILYDNILHLYDDLNLAPTNRVAAASARVDFTINDEPVYFKVDNDKIRLVEEK